MTTKALNYHQVRWAEVLTNYDFVFVPIPSKSNPADAPSCHLDYAQDVDISSSALIPSKALCILYSDSLSPIPSNVIIASLEELQTDQELAIDLH